MRIRMPRSGKILIRKESHFYKFMYHLNNMGYKQEAHTLYKKGDVKGILWEEKEIEPGLFKRTTKFSWDNQYFHDVRKDLKEYQLNYIFTE